MPEYREIPLDLIDEPVLAARAVIDESSIVELAEDIRENGLWEPLVVFPDNGRFRVAAGHRRLLAHRHLQLSPVPCMIHDKPERAMEVAKISENLHRRDVSPAEEAILLAQLIERYDCTEDELCKLVGQKASWVTGRLDLLNGDKQVFDALLNKRISLAAARELNRCKDDTHRADLLDQAQRSGATAGVIHQWVTQRNQMVEQQVFPSEQQTTEAGQPASPAAGPVCAMCGSTEHPYHMRFHMLHFYCALNLKKLLDQMGIGEPAKLTTE